MGISEPEVPALRAVLERAVPKNRGAEFLDLIEDLANDTCLEGEPDCPGCELRKICTFALTRKTAGPFVRRRRPAGPTREAKEAVKTAKGKAADAPAPRAGQEETRAKAAKEAPRSAKSPRGKHGDAK